MASLEQTIRTNENAYRVPDKMHNGFKVQQKVRVSPKAVRKPLGDVTNSSKPLTKDKSLNGFKVHQKVRISPKKAVRKPLRDLSNSNKSSTNCCTENLSVVSENTEVDDWEGEGFLHDHSKCIEAQKQSMSMSMDHFLELVGLNKDSDSTLSEFPKPSMETESEFEFDEFELMNESPMSPSTPKSPNFPISDEGLCWELDWLEKFEIKIKESPPRN